MANEQFFFWSSCLSDDRRAEIVAWVEDLSAEEKARLNDVIEDLRDDLRFGV